MKTTQADLLITQRGCLGVIVLNKPATLNALNMNMVQGITKQLQAWLHDNSVARVVLTGAGERAFCAGGDIRHLYETGVGNPAAGPSLEAQRFFSREYQLNYRIHRYPKPIIALINGITMGGGAGLAMHAHLRIAGSLSRFAMPENALGFFPDVGATRFLNQCGGGIGLWLGLTGSAVKGSAMVSAGLAQMAVPNEAFEDVVQVLQRPLPEPLDVLGLQHLLTPYALPETTLEHQAQVDAVFASPRDLAAVFAALKRFDNGPSASWAGQILKALAKASPTSLALCFQQLNQGKELDAKAALVREFRMAMHALRRPDFYQGVKRAILERSYKPQWQPATLDAVTPAVVAAFFEPPACGDLTLPSS